MTSRAVFLIAAAGLAATNAPSAHGAITLGNGQSASLTLIMGPENPDHQVLIGDKRFTFVAYTSSQFPQANVFITGYIANNPLQGIGFDITGGFGDPTPGDGQFAEFNILYNVEIDAPFVAQGYRIKDVALLFNGAAVGTGSYARVDESVIDFFGQPGQNLLTTLSGNVTAGGPQQQQDFRDFSPNNYLKLQVNKDVKFLAVNPNDSASASFIRQSFSQVVPAPGCAALLGLGAIAGFRRRRN